MKFFWILIIPFVIILTGCEEFLPVKFDNDSEAKLVVEGSITTDTTSHTIILSRSRDFFEKGEQIMETGAEITVSDGYTTYTYTEVEPGIYQTEPIAYGLVGSSYTLNITLENRSVYSASEEIVKLPEIDSIVAIPGPGFDHNAGKRTDGYYINYYGPEPEGPGHCYLWNLYIDGELRSDSIHEQVFTDDEFVDGSYIKDFEIFFIKESELLSDTVEIEIEMFSISEAYYDYMLGLMLETVWKGSPWDGPPANAVSNINNGALGYFRASDRKTAKTTIIKQQTNR
ncbi:MAG: DUF4249 domain-containing protein [Bacteroidales bacterium]|nr:DUF4249 domain-containing protein [Bacteroidales bacterium]